MTRKGQQSPQHVQLHEVAYGPKYRPPTPLATGTKNPQKNPEIRFSYKVAAKTTSGSGFRPYSCSPPSTWLIQPKIAKIFPGHFFKIFGVKVEKFKNILNESQEFPTRDFLTFCGRCAHLPLCQKIHSLSSSNKLSGEMPVFGLSRFLAHFQFFECIEV